MKEETQSQQEKYSYMLPDGQTVELGSSCYRAPELLFRPDLVGDEAEGIHEILANSILKSDMDLRRELFQNIVLSGGSTLFKGFGDRLISDLKRISKIKDIKIKIASPRERLYSTWIGFVIIQIV